MATREKLPLYDAMVRLFAAAMSNAKISTQVLAHTMKIPPGTMKKVMTGCPLPNGAKLTRGGHRGLEFFIQQPVFISRVDRSIVVKAIMLESIWAEYEITLTPDVDSLIAEVEKVVENTSKMKGTNTKRGSTINSGCPKTYRVMWFVKDLIQGEYYNTVHEIMGARGRGKPHRQILRMPQLTPDLPEHRVKPISMPQLDKYSIIQFVNDIQGLITSKEQYVAVIRRLEDKINREYPALIAQKEAEKSAAERTVEVLKSRVKTLEKLTGSQTEEIKNLKRHPKFAGFVRAGEMKK